jgi:hypothetical protein
MLALTGCSILLPGKKEFFQKEVPTFPEQSFKELEALRQAASKAKEAAAETLLAAQTEGVPNSVVGPAKDAVILTDAVSAGVGPPLKQTSQPAEVVAKAALKATAEHNREVDRLRARLKPIEGKDVEGTGRIQIGYFSLIGGLLLVGFLAFVVLRAIVSVAAAANPSVAVGAGAASGLLKIGGRVVSKGFAQIMKGGERFKTAVEDNLEPAIAERVKELFREAQDREQDEEVRTAIKAATGAMKTKD